VQHAPACLSAQFNGHSPGFVNLPAGFNKIRSRYQGTIGLRGSTNHCRRALILAVVRLIPRLDEQIGMYTDGSWVGLAFVWGTKQVVRLMNMEI
jgi:hypothetical protein